jgi:hypothetical protein
VQSRNAWSYSDFTSEIVILAAEKPSVPLAPTTSWSNDQVTIVWQTPASNGAEITSYQILIRQSDGLTFSEDLTNCDGSQAAIMTANSCVIPVQSLKDSPFSLPWGASVWAKVVATNIKGSSTSTEGNGAVIVTKPDTPLNLAEDPA